MVHLLALRRLPVVAAAVVLVRSVVALDKGDDFGETVLVRARPGAVAGLNDGVDELDKARDWPEKKNTQVSLPARQRDGGGGKGDLPGALSAGVTTQAAVKRKDRAALACMVATWSKGRDAKGSSCFCCVFKDESLGA